MPIHRTLNLRTITDDEFEIIDAAVMRCAYAVQNEFGRLFDERVYENALAAKLRAEGFEVHTQVPVRLSQGSFAKTYFLDLVVNDMIYELKVVHELAAEHEAQALHYAMLQKVRHAKLLNFGGPRVQGKVKYNVIAETTRYQPMLRKSGWQIRTPQCEKLINHFRALLADWGTHLSSQLYNEALVHHCGGEEHCLARVELSAGPLKLGSHLVQLHAPNHAFALTCLTNNQDAYQQHLETLLKHASLEAIQWINLNHSRIEITTLDQSRNGKGMGARE
jgi:GxxExxY protein